MQRKHQTIALNKVDNNKFNNFIVVDISDCLLSYDAHLLRFCEFLCSFACHHRSLHQLHSLRIAWRSCAHAPLRYLYLPSFNCCFYNYYLFTKEKQGQQSPSALVQLRSRPPVLVAAVVCFLWAYQHAPTTGLVSTSFFPLPLTNFNGFNDGQHIFSSVDHHLHQLHQKWRLILKHWQHRIVPKK